MPPEIPEIVDPLAIVTDLLSSGDSGVVDPSRRSVLDKALSTNRQGLKVYLAALAQRRTSRMTALLSRIDVVEAELFNEEKGRIAGADTYELLSILKHLTKETHDIAGFLENQASEGGLGEVLGALLSTLAEDGKGTKEDVFARLPARSREKLRRVLSATKTKTKTQGKAATSGGSRKVSKKSKPSKATKRKKKTSS